MNIKRRLGQSEIMLSPLGVGTWQFSNKGGTWNTEIFSDKWYELD